ncbi:unnamed protein product [Albugo candida]|uniref:Uncharacterized protein n=1 Tax=Albugo candida TaxID=65357 RepID=A0A024GE41_9STRA|nr:unnamed protein product [Albugo candida]|eukprot:CCI45028.1 unnamed protein product [Albugo candida]
MVVHFTVNALVVQVVCKKSSTPEFFTIRRALHTFINDAKIALLHLAQNRSGGLFRTYTARFCYRASSGIIRHESSLAACLDRFSQSSVVDDGEFNYPNECLKFIPTRVFQYAEAVEAIEMEASSMWGSLTVKTRTRLAHRTKDEIIPTRPFSTRSSTARWCKRFNKCRVIHLQFERIEICTSQFHPATFDDCSRFRVLIQLQCSTNTLSNQLCFRIRKSREWLL